MSKTILPMIALSLACCDLLAHTSGTHKHVHGEGVLLVAQEHQQWQFEFVLPAADLLGFEHAPESAEQQQQLTSISTKIDSVNALITLPDYCSLISLSNSLANLASTTESNSEVKPHYPAQISAAHDMDNHKEGLQQHSHPHIDVNVTYVFECKYDLTLAEIRIFEWAKSLNSIDTQWITSAKQGATKLSPSSSILRLSN